LAVAIEDAGFEVRDSIAWMYGSGFPKSHDVSKGIDKRAGAEREVVGQRTTGAALSKKPSGESLGTGGTDFGSGQNVITITAPATPAAQQWQGWGTALKPAHEPIVVARKPLIGTVAENVLTHGTGALNIDGCRIGTEQRVNNPSGAPGANNYRLQGGDGRNVENAKRYAEASKALLPTEVTGRWPANVILDESQAAELDKQSGVSKDGVAGARTGAANGYEGGWGGQPEHRNGYGGQGGASRFFYVAKAGKKERPNVDAVAHPTVKPIALMRYLVRLVTPPGGTVLEPFAGSGTTVEACILEGFNCIAIEMTDEYLPLIVERVRRSNEDKEGRLL
jgi:site-specific DNA-methyltransferase (adenine-specific)